jgi:hypothetical protein
MSTVWLDRVFWMKLQGRVEPTGEPNLAEALPSDPEGGGASKRTVDTSNIEEGWSKEFKSTVLMITNWEAQQTVGVT